MDFLAANEDSTTDQSSQNALAGTIMNPANPAASVPEGSFSADSDLFSVTSPSLTPIGGYASSFRPSPALRDKKKSRVIVHRNETSSSQISTPLGSQNPSVTAHSHSLPNSWIHGGVAISPHHNNEEHARVDRHKDDSKGFNLSDSSSEGSGSGSGLDINRLSSEMDETSTITTDLSSFAAVSFEVDDTEEKSTSPGPQISRSNMYIKKERETAAGLEIGENKTELSGEDEDKTGGQGGNGAGDQRVDRETNERVRRLNSSAGHDMLEEKETKEESGSGSEDVSGSGEHGGVDTKEESKKVSDDKEAYRAENEYGEKNRVPKRRGGVQMNAGRNKPTAVSPLMDSTEEQGIAGSQDEDCEDTTLDSPGFGGGLVSEGLLEGGDKEGTGADGYAAVAEFSSVDGLLIDAARSRAVGHLVPLSRLTDGNKAAGEQMEGKYWIMFEPLVK